MSTKTAPISTPVCRSFGKGRSANQHINPSSHQIGSRTYNGKSLQFQGPTVPMPIADLTDFINYWTRLTIKNSKLKIQN